MDCPARESRVHCCGEHGHPTYYCSTQSPASLPPEFKGPAPSLFTRSSKGRSQPIPNQSHGHNSPRKYTLGTHSPSTPGSVYVTSGLPMKPMRQVGPRADKCQVEGEFRNYVSDDGNGLNRRWCISDRSLSLAMYSWIPR